MDVRFSVSAVEAMFLLLAKEEVCLFDLQLLS